MKFKLATSCWTIQVALGFLCGLLSAQENDDNARKLAAANNQMALSFFKYFARSSSENVFFSPLSLFLNFGMLYTGARGETAQDLGRFLGYQETGISGDILDGLKNFSSIFRRSSRYYTFNVANAILINNQLDLLPDFKENVENIFSATVRRVNSENTSQVLNDINSWVNSKTHGKIPVLLSYLDPQTTITILNAVYFKGQWMKGFNPRLTKWRNFYNGGSEGTPKIVSMMFSSGKHLFASDPRFKALELPYQGDHIAMLVLLPRQLDGLRSLEEDLTLEDISSTRNNLRVSTLDVRLPKFKLTNSLDLESVLQQIGLERLFHRGADFSGMVRGHDAVVSAVKHKAVVEVNEKGTEAAAVTMSNLRPISVNRTPTFTINHPFLFLIVDKRVGTILFMGRVNKL